MSWLVNLWIAVRTLWRSRLFTTVAVLSLALGIGATTTVFAVVDAVLWRTLPVREPDRLVLLGFTLPGESEPLMSISYPMFEEMRGRSPAFVEMATNRPLAVTMRTSRATEPASAELVSGQYFSLLGVTAAAGKLFSTEVDGAPGTNPVAVLSYGCWQRTFGGDPAAIGTTVYLNGHPFTIIGVTRQGFFGLEVGSSPDIRVPVTMLPQLVPQPPLLTMRNNFSFPVVARLAPGVTLAQAQALGEALFRQVAGRHAAQETRLKFLENEQIRLQSGSRGISELRRQSSRPLLLLLGGVSLLLVIGCANLAGLQIARAAARQKEIATRLALGATRWRLVRDLMTESLVLATLGAVGGMLLTAWGSALMTNVLARFSLVRLDVMVDARVLAVSMGLALVIGVLLGLVPALQSAHVALVPALQQEGGVAGVRFGRPAGVRKVLVVAQIALSLLLLVAAGLFVRTLANLSAVELGFTADHVLQVSLDTNERQYEPARTEEFYRQLLERAAVTPGASSAALAQHALFTSYTRDGLVVDGFTPPAGRPPAVMVNQVSTRFFETLGMTVLMGREFETRDDMRAPKVAIVSRSFAARYFGTTNPIGRRIGVGAAQPDREIVGVVNDAKFTSLRSRVAQVVYLPVTQATAPVTARTLYVRTTTDPATVAAAVGRDIRALDPDLALHNVRRMRDRLDDVLVQERLTAVGAACFGVFSLLLTAMGIYGLLAYDIARRTREIAIRLALGATRRDLAWLVWRDTLRMAVAGLVVGTVAALALTPLVATYLFGVTARDPLALVSAIVCLALMILGAVFLPVRRAVRVSPVGALRRD